MLPVPTQPFSLFLDVDGTLVDIAARPDDVGVPSSLLAALEAVAEHLEGAMALVSGRAIADLDRLFAPMRFRASGVHGAEMRLEPDGVVAISPEHLLDPATISAIEAVAARYPGTLVENKRLSVAVHFRAVPTCGPALHTDLDALVRTLEAQGLRILPGHMVLEVKRSGFDKGTAIVALQAQPPFLGRKPVFLGDDVTDLPGFAQVLRLGGLAYSVSTPRAGLSGHFTDPPAVRSWIGALATELAAGLRPH